MSRRNPYADLSVDKWKNVPEDAKAEEFNKCIRKAQNYIDRAFTDRKAERVLLGAALAEIETALEIYPKDFKTQTMKKLIEKQMEKASIARGE
ncbi:MAG: hypothetical protein HZA78_06485 [Candidatus Schekmanbacteria bacterium]|nr:hypothetical protein [Candidatus Schekmanbacteria bacterium]